MMIRILSATAGLLSAGMAALLEATGGAYSTASTVWPIGTGILCAGVTYGVLSSKANNAHKRITETNQRVEAEKQDREKAIAELKGDMNRGFDGIERQIERHTNTVLRAVEGASGSTPRRHREEGDDG